MSSQRARKTDDGFTLVELLIVIVVLGLLAGIAVLSADGVSEHATDSCESANERIDATRDGVVAVRGGEPPEIVAGGDC